MSVTFWDSHSIKSLLMLMIRCFQILLKKKTLYLGGSVFGRLTRYINTLTFNPSLGSGVCILLCGNFSLCGNSVFILFISSKRLETAQVKFDTLMKCTVETFLHP